MQTAWSQYYIKGVVQNDKGSGLYNVRLFLKSKKNTLFTTGSTGAFGIPAPIATDSITIVAEGFDTLYTTALSTGYNTYTLKVQVAGNSRSKNNRIFSFSKFDDSTNLPVLLYYHGLETYAPLKQNKFLDVLKYPETGFTLNTDCASYSNIRRFLNNGLEVPSNAVRIEEMLNYFDCSIIPYENKSDTFSFAAKLTPCPWNDKNRLFFLNLQAPLINLDTLPPCNLVFLIDVSGSMEGQNRLTLVQKSLKMLVKNLRQQDSLAIVVYGGLTGIMLQPTSGCEKDSINSIIDQLTPFGETPGEAAIKTAYQVALRMHKNKADTRIIIATDGDFNVGQSSDKELEDLISVYRQSGIYLTCLGVGMGNFKDSKMEALAHYGNGNYAYIDNVEEGEKVLVKEFTKTVYTVADDAWMTCVFNPLCVKSSRLIGFDNTISGSKNAPEETEGGELGTGHNILAAFEMMMNTDSAAKNESEIADITLFYRQPSSEDNCSQNFTANWTYKPMLQQDSILIFASAVVMFGEKLKSSPYGNEISWDNIISLAQSVANKENYIQTEFIDLVNKAKKIYPSDKKKKKIN